MGCGKTREVQGVNLTIPDPISIQNPSLNIDTVHEEKSLDEESLKEIEIDKVAIRPFTRVQIIKQDYGEIGKEGEDCEAGVIVQGKKKEQSLDFSFRKMAIPKKLPPIKNPPILTLPSTLSVLKRHKPDMDFVQELLDREDNKGFGDLDKESFRVHGEDSLRKIMEELSIEMK